MEYVIIGNGTAAVGAIEGIRKVDELGKIHVISDEKYHTYSRPLISYYLQGKTDLERIKYRADDFYEKNGCVTHFGKTVVKIDKKLKKVVLNSGEELVYNKLLIATGSTPFVPKFEGLAKLNYFTFTTLDDALEIEKAVSSKSRVLIVGAGLIGLKCAECLVDRVKSICVVERANKVLSSILDDESSWFVQEHLIKSGIDLYISDSVVEFKENTACLESGKKIEFDVLVMAVGVRSNMELASAAGIKVDRGILIDERMKTSVEDIYSAGDCSQGYDSLVNEKRVLALLPNAYFQGECAGINMTGADAKFDNAIAMNAIGFFGLHLATAGEYEGETFVTKTPNSIKKLYYLDNKLRGFILIGDVNKAGIYTSLIRDKTPLDKVDFEELCISPSLLAFNQNYRNSKLGGAH